MAGPDDLERVWVRLPYIIIDRMKREGSRLKSIKVPQVAYKKAL
jgi:hypothetical protein